MATEGREADPIKALSTVAIVSFSIVFAIGILFLVIIISYCYYYLVALKMVRPLLRRRWFEELSPW